MYAIIFHAHQKLDRVAHRHFSQLKPQTFFPTIRQITRFEAGHGPDGAKLKRQNDGTQPWHFIDPHDAADTDLHETIEHHYQGLKEALAKKDDVRAAFEAAWLAHALVDGLTPAHHYPYEEELEAIRGEDRDTRKGLMGRLYVKSDNMLETMQRSLRLVGPKGLLTNHAMFEAGAYTIIAPLKLRAAMPSHTEIDSVIDKGVVAVFDEAAKEIARLKIYERFIDKGWTQALTRDVKRELAPRMVKMVTLSWYAASHEASQAKS